MSAAATDAGAALIPPMPQGAELAWTNLSSSINVSLSRANCAVLTGPLTGLTRLNFRQQIDYQRYTFELMAFNDLSRSFGPDLHLRANDDRQHHQLLLHVSFVVPAIRMPARGQ